MLFQLGQGGLKVSGFTFSNVIFSVIMLCVVGASELSPLLKVICLLVKFDTRIFTDVFPLMMCMPFMMLIFRSFPFVKSYLDC